MNYQYFAKASNGKTMSGSRAADNEAELLEWIKSMGWVPIDVKRNNEFALQVGESMGKGIVWKNGLDLSSRIKIKDKALFFRQLSTMISAGIPIAATMEILKDQTANKRLKRIVSQMNTKISSGVPLWRAIADYPKCFDPLATALIRSGEESGNLDDSLSKLAGFLEAQDSLRKKIISAMTYPVVVIIIATVVLGIMVAVVIPQFEKAFSNLNVEMPWLTRMTFKIGAWAKVNWYYVPLTVIGLIASMFMLKKVKMFELGIDTILLKIPVFGDIIYKSSISRSFKTMSSLLRSGVPVLQAIEMSGDVALNAKIKAAFMMMRDSAAMGASMNEIIKAKKLFPPMIIHMIAVGEETGRTDEMLERVANWYESELTEKIKRLSSILEPIMMVFVGIIVGFMVLAIFLPIMSAIQAFI